MIILKNNLNLNNIYIIGKHITNGSQTFTIDELSEICIIYRIPKNIELEVREAYDKNQKLIFNKGECWLDLCNYNDLIIRLEIIKQCNDIDILKTFLNDEEPNVRIELAKHNKLELLKVLMNDINSFVRIEVAKHNNPEILKLMLNDEHSGVLFEIAKHNNPEILKELMYNKKWFIRLEVAKHNNQDILKHLINDDEKYVVLEAQKLLEAPKMETKTSFKLEPYMNSSGVYRVYLKENPCDINLIEWDDLYGLYISYNTNENISFLDFNHYSKVAPIINKKLISFVENIYQHQGIRIIVDKYSISFRMNNHTREKVLHTSNNILNQLNIKIHI